MADDFYDRRCCLGVREIARLTSEVGVAGVEVDWDRVVEFVDPGLAESCMDGVPIWRLHDIEVISESRVGPCYRCPDACFCEFTVLTCRESSSSLSPGWKVSQLDTEDGPSNPIHPVIEGVPRVIVPPVPLPCCEVTVLCGRRARGW